MLASGLNELSVLNIPGQTIAILARHERKVQDQLAEAILRARCAQILDEIQELTAGRVDHGRVSPTLG
jgi:hypothetical protein